MYSEVSDRQFSPLGISNLQRCWGGGFSNCAQKRRSMLTTSVEPEFHLSEFRWSLADDLLRLVRSDRRSLDGSPVHILMHFHFGDHIVSRRYFSRTFKNTGLYPSVTSFGLPIENKKGEVLSRAYTAKRSMDKSASALHLAGLVAHKEHRHLALLHSLRDTASGRDCPLLRRMWRGCCRPPEILRESLLRDGSDARESGTRSLVRLRVASQVQPSS